MKAVAVSASASAPFPQKPGAYLYTAADPEAEPLRVDVVSYKGVLMARIPDDDEFELHPIDDLLGTWETPR